MGAGAWSNISMVLVRLMQVPLLLLYIGVEDYGRWLVISSLPSWLSLANMGFGSVASNEITMSVAGGDLPRARSLFSSTAVLIMLLSIAGLLLTSLITPWVPWDKILLVSGNRHHELGLAVLWLVMTVFVSFWDELFNGRLRAAKKAHQAMLIGSLKPWISLLSLFVVLQFSTRFDFIAFASFASICMYLLLLQSLSQKALPALSFSLQEVDRKWFSKLLGKGLAFQAFPLGNALLFQGNLLVVQAILGPAAVALFGTARTLVRSINQVLALINHAIWPELSYLFGANDKEKAAKLHRMGVGFSIVVTIIGVAVLALAGSWIYEFWVGKTIALPRHLLLIFLLPIPFNALWFTSSVVHAACNQHEGLAKRYLTATGISLLFCVLLAHYMGIEGAALSTLAVDLLLIPYVFTKSLDLVGDKWQGFLPALFQDTLLLLADARKFVHLKMAGPAPKQEA